MQCGADHEGMEYFAAVSAKRERGFFEMAWAAKERFTSKYCGQ